MKITVNEDRSIVLKEVYSGIILETSDGETMGICMRDSGFEFSYQGQWYSAQNGKIEPMKELPRRTGLDLNPGIKQNNNLE